MKLFKFRFDSFSNFIRSVAMIVGTIIGAGMFGIPYAMSRSGFPIGIIMLFLLGGVIIILNLAYGEVILRTKNKHQFPGYVEKYLGKKWKFFALFSILASLYGGLTAYIIKVGELLDFLLPLEGITNSYFWSVAFFILMSLAVLIGLKVVSRLDSILTFLLVFAFLALAFFLFPEMDKNHLTTYSTKLNDLFIPYGVILFSLGGSTILAEVKGVLGDKRQFKKVILIGTLTPIIIYFFFSMVVLGVTGENTSDDAIRGLANYNILFSRIGACLAILSMSTAFLGLATILTSVFNQDFKIPHFASWLLAVLPPFIVFTLGLNSFISVISIAGSIMAGTEGILIIKMYEASKSQSLIIPPYELHLSRFTKGFLILIFSLGIIYELLHLSGLL